MPRLAPFLRAVAHTRPSQLWHRARLTARRRVLVASPALARLAERALDAPAPAVRSDPPQPPFTAHRRLAERVDGALHVRFGGKTVALHEPVDWPALRRSLSTALDRLAVHYQEYLESVDDASFVGLAAGWAAAHRPHAPRYWLEDWNAYAVSIRAVVYMQQIAVRRLAPADSAVAPLVEACARHLRFLERNLELDIRGNHLIKNIRALLWGARFFVGPEADRWRATGIALLHRELREQVLPDGTHFELSPAYHAQVFADLLECRVALGDDEVPELSSALDRMAQALADLTHPDGLPSLFNDGGLHMARPAAECLAVHARLGGRPATPRALAALEDAGYFGARDRDDLVLCDCGRIGPDHLPAHAHGDVLSFEWSVDGRRVVVDAGVYEYEPGERRAWSRSTRAHNTVTVADADQAEFWMSFRVGRRPHVHRVRFASSEGGFELEGTHDGFRKLDGAPRHTRRFVARPRRIEVHDIVTGGAGQPVVARILLAPGLTLDAGDRGVYRISGGPRPITLLTDSTVKTRASWWFPDFGDRKEALQVEIVYGAAPCSGSFVLEAALR